MGKAWPIVPLGEVLTLSRERVKLDPNVEYKRITVRMNGSGAVLRDTVLGNQIKTEVQYVARAGQLIFSRIDARNGAFDLVPYELDGAVVSGNFQTFAINTDRLLASYLQWFVRRSSLWDACRMISEGTTNRVPVKIEDFQRLTIPLLPVDEQRRLVARIEELAAKIEEARRFRHEATIESEAIRKAAMREVFQTPTDYDDISLESICVDIIDNLHSNPIYADDGLPCVRSPDVGWGTLSLETALKTSEEEYTRRTVRGEPKPDDIVLVREGGGTGKAAIVKQGQRFSLGQRVMMIRPDKSKVEPKYFLYQVLSPAIYDEQIVPLSKGSASPHLNIGALRQFRFRLASMSEQRRIVAYLDSLQAKVDALKKLQTETAAELDALLPSILDKAFKGELVN